MKSRTRTIVLTKNELQEYLVKNSRGFDTKDYEFYAAILLVDLYEKRLKKIYCVGIPVKFDSPEKVPQGPMITEKKLLKKYLSHTLKMIRQLIFSL